MAPRTSSSLPVAPPPPPPAVVDDDQYRCRFCGKIFDNRFVFSAHYYTHTGLPDHVYLANAPKHSKVRRRILARLAGLQPDEKPKRRRRGRVPKPINAPARALSPDPIRVAFPPGFLGRRRPGGPARSLYPDPLGARPGVGPKARRAGPAIRAAARQVVPQLKEYSSWMERFKSRAQEVGGVVGIRTDDGAGPSASNAGFRAVPCAPVFGPPPGFGHVIPDLNFPQIPVSTKIRSVVKKEIIIID